MKLLTGKYKGKIGHVVSYTKAHQLSKDKRLKISVATVYGWKTLLYNEYNLIKV